MVQTLRIISRICQIVFALFLAYISFRLLRYHLDLITFPYSNTLREGAMMMSTDALLKGLNPYNMATQPQFMNQYGIMYPLLVWPWAKFLGNTIFIHRLITGFSILGSCTLIFLVLKKKNVPLLLNIWAFLMLYASLMYPGTSTPTIDPGATGMFFFLLTIFIPWFCKFSYPSLIMSVLCALLAFYTKLYTFLGAFIMLSYLFLFMSRVKGLFYGFLLLIVTVLSISIVNQILPAYFDNCFFAAVNMGPAWSNIGRLYEQIHIYNHIHFWLFILIAAYLIGFAVKYVTDFKKPLIQPHFPLVVYAAICSSLVLYFSLGRHTGAMLWYFFQLLSPFLLISCAWIFSRNQYWPMLCAPLLIYNLYTFTTDQDHKWFTDHNDGWPQVSSIIDQHDKILNSPVIAPLLVEKNKEVFDNGQAEYFGTGGQRTSFMKLFFKEDQRVNYQLDYFFYRIRNMVENKEFDLIILQPGLLPLGVGDDIKKFYTFQGQALLYAPQDRRPYAVTFWSPNK